MRDHRRRLYSVRVRILGAILVVTASGLGVSGGVAYSLQHASVLAGIDAELRQDLDGVRAVAEGTSAGGTAGPESAPAPAASFEDTNELVFQVVGAVSPPFDGATIGIVDGESRWVPPAATDLDLKDEDFTARVIADTTDGSTVVRTTSMVGNEIRYLAVPITTTGDATRGVFVSAVNVDARRDDLDAVFRVYWGVAAAALVLVALVGWFVAGRLLRPVRDLQRTASRISVSALDERIPVSGNDDLSQLTRTINDMMDRLEESFVGQTRLVNDVRHELATPITIVRGHLELLDADDPADVEDTRAIALDELDRMARLVAEIAYLADAEQSGSLSVVGTDIGALTRDVFAKVRVIPGRDWALGRVAAGEAMVDPSRLTQAWLQLADNASKYSEPGTRIEIGSALHDDRLLCWVADEGPGIPPEVHSRIFERFGRADDGRGIAGSGLGLSIVQAIVGAHDGRVRLDSVVGRGSTFTIEIPTGGRRNHDTHSRG